MKIFRKINDAINRMALPVKAAIVYTIASFISRGFHFITTPLFTRIMTVEQIGIVSNFTTWESIFSTFATLGLTSGAVNISLKEFKSDRGGLLKTSQTLSTIGSLFVGLLTVLLFPLLSTFFGMPVHYIFIIFICIIFNSSKSFWMSWSRYEYKYKSVALVTIFSSILTALFSILVVLIAGKNGVNDLAGVRIYSSSAVTVLFCVPIFIYILTRKGKLLNKHYASFSLIIGLPMIIHTLSKTLLSASDRVMISYFLGPESLGYYSVLYTLSSLALIAWEAINASLLTYIFENLDKGTEGERKINKASLPLLLLFALVVIFLISLAPEIIKIIATDRYLPAIYVMPPVASGVFFTAVYSLYANLLMYKKKTNFVMIGTAVAAVLNIVLNLIFIKKFGYIAAAYTTLVSYVFLGLIYYIISKKIFGHPVFKNQSILGISIVVVLFGLLCNFLYSSTRIRIAVIMMILLAFFVFSAKSNVIKEIRNGKSKK